MGKTLTFGILVALASFAWAQGTPLPAATDFQSDVCAVCGMKVTSKSYAAQILSEGSVLFFDDIGCLVQYERSGKLIPETIQARYVRAVTGDRWVLAEGAVWVATKDVRTPMGYGFHAFADRASADAFLGTLKKGTMAQLIPWTEVQKRVPGAPKMGSMGKM